MQTLNNNDLAFLAMLGHPELTVKVLRLYAQKTFLFTEMFCPHLNAMWNEYVKLLGKYKKEYGFNISRDIIAAGLVEAIEGDARMPEELKDKCDTILQRLAAGDVPDLDTGNKLVGHLVQMEGNRRLMAKANANADILTLQQSLDASRRAMEPFNAKAEEEHPEDEIKDPLYHPFKDIRKLAKKVVLVPTGINWMDEVSSGGGRAGELWLILGPSGGGKCHSPETEVLMYDGTLRQIKDVKVGDQMMGPDSKPRTVKSTTQGTGDMYLVKMNKGESYKCNSEHTMTLAVVNAEGMRYKGVKYNQGDLVDVTVREYLGMSKSMRNKLKHTRVQVEFQPRQEPELDPYFVGVYLGDGNSRFAGITTGDACVCEYCLGISGQYGWKCTIKGEKGANAWRINISNPDEWHKKRGKSAWEIIRANVMARGIKRILAAYKYASVNNRRRLLAGLLDSDGYNHNNSFEISQKNKDLAYDIVFVARSLGYLVTIRECHKKCTNTGAIGLYYRITISGNFKDLPMQVPHKIAHQPEGVGHVTTGFKIEPLGKGPYAGVELDGDGRYLLGDFTITHNSMLTVQYACAQAMLGNNTMWVTYEQSLEGDLAERMIANITDESLDHIRDIGFDNLPESLQQRFLDSVAGVDDRLSAVDMTRVELDPSDPDDYGGIRSIWKQFNREKEAGRKPKTVIIDWFGSMLIKVAGKLGVDLEKRYRFLAQAEIDIALEFAKKEQVLVIFLHQLDVKGTSARPTYMATAAQAQNMHNMQDFFTLVFVMGVRDSHDVCWFHSGKARKSKKVVRTLRLIGDKAKFIMENGWLPDKKGEFYKAGSDTDGLSGDFHGLAENYTREVE